MKSSSLTMPRSGDFKCTRLEHCVRVSVTLHELGDADSNPVVGGRVLDSGAGGRKSRRCLP